MSGKSHTKLVLFYSFSAMLQCRRPVECIFFPSYCRRPWIESCKLAQDSGMLSWKTVWEKLIVICSPKVQTWLKTQECLFIVLLLCKAGNDVGRCIVLLFDFVFLTEGHVTSLGNVIWLISGLIFGSYVKN